jgi:hypothetical protein
MENVSLSEGTRTRLNALFAEADRGAAERLLVERCGSTLPFSTPSSLERIRFAALKVSEGDLAALRSAVKLANTDWRDLLVDAGFADDVDAHRAWFPRGHAA